jgi:putative ABC transport system permease protein
MRQGVAPRRRAPALRLFSFAWRLCRRHWRAGELSILALALVVSVAAVSAVGFFTDRVQQALARQSNLLLGADLVLTSDYPLSAEFSQEASRRGLLTSHTIHFPSMVTHAAESHLAEIKAVQKGYPLRGRLLISAKADIPATETVEIPQPGTVWVEPRLLEQLEIQTGDKITLGQRTLLVNAVLRAESDRAGDIFSFAPRLMMNSEDVSSTGLIQFGSRIKYRLLVAGNASEVAAYRHWATPRLKSGVKLEDVSDARPEIRNALAKARQFLGLAAMSSVVLAAVAMALAGLRFVRRNLDACAVMRCLGASQSFILRAHLLQLSMVGLLGGLVGCVAGYLAQIVLSRMVGGLLLEGLPQPSLLPALQGLLGGLAVLLGVTWPLLAKLRDVQALRVLRSDLPVPRLANWLSFSPALAVVSVLILWTAKDARLGWIALAGLTVFLALAVLFAWLSVRWIRSLGRAQAGSLRFGTSNLARHPLSSISTVAGFSLGLMALLLVTLVRGDLLRSWQATLPPDAPNRFVINIQKDQLAELKSFFLREGLPPPAIKPMVRGRLVAVNDKPLDVSRFDERARRLVEREFNLSWAQDMEADNRITAGHWWKPEDAGLPMLSLEQGIAETLGLKLGDWLTYDIAGTQVRLRVVNLRKVEWDSMRANFFGISNSGMLEKFSASYITSFYVPPHRETMLNRLVKTFPNLTVIDVSAIMVQVRSIMDRMAGAVQFVFGFCLAAGILVLYASLAVTSDERALEYTLLRVLGARRRQILLAMLTEFFLVALLSAVVAACGASVIAWFVSHQVLNLTYLFDAGLLAWSIGIAGVVIPLAAWVGLRKTLNLPPSRLLKST